MPTTASPKGRPPVGPPKRVRFEADFLEFAQMYADEHCGGNLNRAVREISDIGRRQVERRQRTRQQKQHAA